MKTNCKKRQWCWISQDKVVVVLTRMKCVTRKDALWVLWAGVAVGEGGGSVLRTESNKWPIPEAGTNQRPYWFSASLSEKCLQKN